MGWFEASPARTYREKERLVYSSNENSSQLHCIHDEGIQIFENRVGYILIHGIG